MIQMPVYDTIDAKDFRKPIDGPIGVMALEGQVVM